MEALGPFHPQIVHTPIAMLVFSALFAIVGRLFDREWLRKASVLLLVVGALGAWAAYVSGEAAEEIPEDTQGVPHEVIEQHEVAGKFTLAAAFSALALTGLAALLKGSARGVVASLALVAQVWAAVMVGVAGHRGGKLVYEHGAGVKRGGEYLVHPDRGAASAGDHHDAAGERK
jgi:uncharacterized membrane protein